MSRATRLVRVGVLLLVAVFLDRTGSAGGAGLPVPAWRPVAPGIEFSHVACQGPVRWGGPGIAAVRLDPARCRIEPYHESNFPREPASTIDGWTRRLGAPVVFNAGLYREDRKHLGVLRRGGKDVGGSRQSTYKAMLVAGSGARGFPAATLLDLERAGEADRAGRYDHAVQSMMLFDREGDIRVRRSDRAAPRTVVALDRGGRLWVLVTEGSYTLWDLAGFLRDGGWGLVSAMAMDGGREANLAVTSDVVRYRSHQAEGDGDPDPYFGEPVTLPAVVAVWPLDPRRSGTTPVPARP